MSTNFTVSAIQQNLSTNSTIEGKSSIDSILGTISTKTFQTWVVYMVVQAILGILALEYAWCRTKRFRKAEESRDEGFPAWRRRDV